MEIKERIENLIGVLKASIEPGFEEELQAIDELNSVAMHTYESFKDNGNILDVTLTPSKYEDVTILGIYIDYKISKVFLKSANINVDFQCIK